jgi:hypothetical protein
MERRFYSMEKKRGGDMEAARDDFIPYNYFFGIGEGVGKLLKLL